MKLLPNQKIKDRPEASGREWPIYISLLEGGIIKVVVRREDPLANVGASPYPLDIWEGNKRTHRYLVYHFLMTPEDGFPTPDWSILQPKRCADQGTEGYMTPTETILVQMMDALGRGGLFGRDMEAGGFLDYLTPVQEVKGHA